MPTFGGTPAARGGSEQGGTGQPPGAPRLSEPRAATGAREKKNTEPMIRGNKTNEAGKGGDKKMAGQLEALATRVAALEGKLAGMEAANQARVSRLETAFESLLRRLEKLEGEEEEDDEEDEEEEGEEEEGENDIADDAEEDTQEQSNEMLSPVESQMAAPAVESSERADQALSGAVPMGQAGHPLSELIRTLLPAAESTPVGNDSARDSVSPSNVKPKILQEKLQQSTQQTTRQAPKSPPANQQKQHECPNCGRICGNAGGLASHMRGSQCPGKPQVSSVFTFGGSPISSSSQSTQQATLQAPKSPPATQQKQHECPNCGRICGNAGGLASHMRGSQCPGKTQVSSRMTFGGSPIRSPQPPAQSHSCPDCGRVCASAAGLASHMRGSQCPGRAQVSRSRDFEDSLYGGGSMSGWGGGGSSWSGGGGGQYTCPNCGRSCASGAGLASHMRGSRCN